MAFETFAAQALGTGRRRLVIGVSAGFHVALIGIGVVGSYWRVDELAPPAVIVTRPVSAPPPQGGPKAGAARSKASVRQRPVRERELTQPPEVRPVAENPEPAITAEPTTTGPEDIGAGGDGTGGGPGPGGGTGIGTGGHGGGDGACDGCRAPEPSPQIVLPPTIGKQQLLSGAMPHLPAPLVRLGVSHVVLAKICVSASGEVSGLRILSSSDPTIDANVTGVVSTWRFRPYRVDGHPVPFCYVARFAFETR